MSVRARARSRLSEALVCPYCRDGISRSAVVACARSGCGALYHRECWEECARRYGGCAVFGCESHAARPVGLLGYLVRLARMAIAAILFPPRVVGQLGREGYRVNVRDALAIHLQCFRRDLERYWYVVFVVVFLPALVLGGLVAIANLDPHTNGIPWGLLIGLVPASLWVLPFVFALVLMALLYGTLALSDGFARELAALRRAGDGTTIDAMRRAAKPITREQG